MRQINLILGFSNPDVFSDFPEMRSKLKYRKVTSSDEVLESAMSINPDIIFLDPDLEPINGIELCSLLKKSGIPSLVVFYSERREGYVQLECFKAGADDFIIRPSNRKVLVYRIFNLLNEKANFEPDPVMNIGKLIIDRSQLLVSMQGKKIHFPQKEFGILCLLASAPGRVFTSGEIYETVWSREMQGKSRSIDVHIRRIRAKIGNGAIRTIRRVGYSLETDFF